MPKSKSKKSSSVYYSAKNNIPRQPLFPIEEKQKTKKIRPPRPMRPYSPPKKTKKVRPPRPERPYAPPRHSRRAPFKIMPQQKLRKYSTPPMVEEAIEPVFKNPRKLSKKGQELIENLLPKVNLNLSNNNHQLDHLIDKKSPILLDIGFGSGDFLYQISRKKPQWNLVSILELGKENIVKK